MEENSLTKRPVVILSRVPTDNNKPTSAPPTPVKKRAGRLAAEPQLNLIQENVTVNSPRSKRKSVDEKPVTPARRSTRIKSNTSLVLETIQTYESPRAKRAARRSSLAGSDTESNVSITSTRRSRRNSKTEETQVDIAGKPAKDLEVCDVILEETDSNNSQKSPNTSPHNSTVSSRRSPKLANKEITVNNSLVDLEKPNVVQDLDLKLPAKQDNNSRENSDNYEEKKKKVEDKAHLTPEENLNLAKEDVIKKEKITEETYLNKSLSALDHKEKKNRIRTKSWTNTNSIKENVDFLSDNESVKKNIKRSKIIKMNKTLEDNGSNDTLLNKESTNSDIPNNTCNESKFNTPTKSTKLIDKSYDATSDKMNSSIKVNLNKEHPVTNIPYSNSSNQNLHFNVAVVIENEDSNDQMNIEDQCVPVVHKDSSLSPKSNAATYNDSCEPMDIDETISKNTSLVDFTNKSYENKIPRKDNIYEINENSLTNSPRKHTIEGYNNPFTDTNKSQTTKNDEDKNKSTLNLSQINENKNLQNSVNVPDSTKGKENMKSVTPLKNNFSQKLGIQTSTPVVSDNKDRVEKNETKKKSKNKNILEALKQDDSDTDEESTEYQNSLIDDEADEAMEDYESGDSLDDEDRIYNEENEVIEKGETLTSDEEFSNDSDYEKDSFVVTSDEDDVELLSGTGDDLSVSNEELSMSAKSKKKYNDRKLKEQKRASREMYESRHKLNISNESNAQKKHKRQRIESENDANVKPMKGSRLRLESSSDAITETSSGDVSKKMKPRKLSESFEENAVIKNEITYVFNESTVGTDDPLSLDKENTSTIKKEIEEIEVEMNKSIVSENQSVDPLQATVANDDSMSSENEEIMQNYDTVLSNLNTQNQKKPSLNISLNLNKKDKSKSVDPIIDQLNLTDTRAKSKSIIKKEIVDEITSKEETTNKNDTTSKQDSSDSIDLQLLFSDSSNDSDNKDKKTQKTDSVDFIPLRSSLPKTDVRKESGTMDEDSDDSPLEVSFKGDKKKQLITNDSESELSIDEPSLNITKKLKKNMSESPISLKSTPDISLNNTGSTKKMDKSTDEAVAESYSNTSQSYSKKKSESSVNEESNLDTSKGSSKKKNVVDATEEEAIVETYFDISHSASNKKKKNSESSVHEESIAETYLDISQSDSKKKKKNSESFVHEEFVAESYFDNSKSDSKKKKKQSESSLVGDAVVDTYFTVSQSNPKKKRNKSESSLHEEFVAESYFDSSKSDSKKKKNSESSLLGEAAIETYFDVSQSDPQKKRKKSESSLHEEIVAESYFDTSKGDSKKKKKKSESSLLGEAAIETYFDDSQNDTKKKRKKSESSLHEEFVAESCFDSSKSDSKKKKKKSESSLLGEAAIETYFDDSQNDTKKKRKKSESSLHEEFFAESCLDSSKSDSKKKKKKKSESSLLGDAAVETYCDVSQSDPKKKREKSESSLHEEFVAESYFDSSKSDSKKKKKSESSLLGEVAVETYFDDSQSDTKKKKKKSESSVDDGALTEPYSDISRSDLKKKKSESSVDQGSLDVVEPKADDQRLTKKHKKKYNPDTPTDDKGSLDVVEPKADDQRLTKKHKKKYNPDTPPDDKVLKENDRLDQPKKKKLRINSEQHSSQNKVSESTPEDISDVSKKHEKKLKIQALNEKNQNLFKDELHEEEHSKTNESTERKRKKKHKKTRVEDNHSAGIEEPKQTHQKTQNEDNVQRQGWSGTKVSKSKKRKQREDDFDNVKSKIFKTTELPQLSSATLDQLKKRTDSKVKTEAVSTTKFIVEETRKRKRLNPSNFLEESVCLNVSPIKKKLKHYITMPKVLPFIPTASTSDSGFTTKFSVNIMPKQIEFVTQSSDITNFKRDTLMKRKRVTNEFLLKPRSYKSFKF